jgi:hypothetical protein
MAMNEDASTNLSDRAAKLVRTLPDDAHDLTQEALQGVFALIEDIGQAYEECTSQIKEMNARAAERGASDNDPTMDRLTKGDREAFEAGTRLHLEAERAQAALAGWEERSGWRDVLARLGMDSQVVDSPMTVSEDLDGSLSIFVPSHTESDLTFGDVLGLAGIETRLYERTFDDEPVEVEAEVEAGSMTDMERQAWARIFWPIWAGSTEDQRDEIRGALLGYLVEAFDAALLDAERRMGGA